MRQRKKKSVKKLNSFLTGKVGLKAHKIGIKVLRQWTKEHPPWHSIVLKCESALPQKQFDVWSKWFKRREDSHWEFIEKDKSFFFFQSPTIE